MILNVQSTKLGSATVALIDLYTIPSKLGDLIEAPSDERTPADNALLASTVDLPVQCIFLRSGDVSVLVDAGAYEVAFDSSGRQNYQPPPSLFEALADLGVKPEDVGHVIITHAHGDHFNATTIERDGGVDPAFPRARVYVGRGDWDKAQGALANPASLESRTFGVLNQAGRLDPVEGDRVLGNGITILAAPGETPGHQIVRLWSEGQTLYCVGDLYHHPIEVDHPTWMVPWADRAANVASRRSLAEAALAENALLIATHISGIGRLARKETGVEWMALS